jgi:hypothetical protein
MQRRVCSLAVALVFGSASAVAQDGDLSKVTMRVLDDLRDVDAVVLELDANRGGAEEGAARGGAARDAGTRDGDRDAARVEATPRLPWVRRRVDPSTLKGLRPMVCWLSQPFQAGFPKIDSGG